MKLRKKLFLSATALAATAVTLTSTTYAWYVSNSEATVDGITGAVSSTGAEGNLLVAYDNNGTPEEFTNELSLKGYVQTPEGGLVPVHKQTAYNKVEGVTQSNFAEKKQAANGGKLYTTSDNSTYTEATAPEADEETTLYEKFDWVDSEGNGVRPNAIKFRFWITSTTDRKVTPKLTLTNTTTSASKKVQELKNTTGAPKVMKTDSYGDSTTNVAKNSNFTSNALYAIRIGIASTTQGDDGNATNTALAAATQTVYNPGTLASGSKSTGIDITTPTSKDEAFSFTKTGDANSYYVALMNNIPAGITNAASTVTSKKVTIPAGTTKAELDRLVASETYYKVDVKSADQIKTDNLIAAPTESGAYNLEDGETTITAGATLKADITCYVPQVKQSCTSPAESGDTTDWAAFDLEANQAMLFEFTIWLEGTDAQCFDSCKGQTFDIAFNFESSKPTESTTPTESQS